LAGYDGGEISDAGTAWLGVEVLLFWLLSFFFFAGAERSHGIDEGLGGGFGWARERRLMASWQSTASVVLGLLS
jgi:hypothetical protein